MDSKHEEIHHAKLTLGVTDAQIRLVPDDEASVIIRGVESHFVTSSGRRWWWEDFRGEFVSLHFPDGQGWRRLSELVPSAEEMVWFIVENIEPTNFLVYETTVMVAQQVIGECSGFEYYLTPKGFAWLLGENHHDVVFAVGEPVVTTLIILSVHR